MGSVNKAGATTKLVSDFTEGFIAGTGKKANTAKIAGDVAGAFVPGLGQVKAVQDIYSGLKEKDPISVVSGIIGLIPVAGGAGKAAAKVGKEGAKVAGKQGFKVAAMQLGQTALQSAKKVASSPEGKKRLTRAAEGAATMALSGLVEKLTGMKEQGEAPEVETRTHRSFIDARKTVESKLGEKPGPRWFDLIELNDKGKKEVVGRHDMGEKGFRFIRPEEGAEDDTLQLLWWKDTGDTFGIESCQASNEEVNAVLRAYTARRKSFRSTRG